MIIQKFCFSLLGIALLITGCTGLPKGLTPVTEFDKERYLGTWYEIARLDHSFERNLTNVRADQLIICWGVAAGQGCGR